MTTKNKIICLLSISALALAQVARQNIDNTFTGTNVFQGTLDSAGATRTRPFKLGSSLPVTCSIGDYFNLTSASAGSNTYACTATDTWTLQGGAGSGTVTHSAGALTNLSIPAGAGTGDIKITNITTDSALNDMNVPGVVKTGSAVDPGTFTGTGSIHCFMSGSNYICLGGKTTHTQQYVLRFPDSAPSGGQVLAFPTPSSNISEGVWTSASGGGGSSTLDGTIIEDYDEFWPTNSNIIGKLGWINTGTGGYAYSTPNSGATLVPGIVDLVSNGIVNGAGIIHLGGAAFGFPQILTPNTVTNQDYYFYIASHFYTNTEQTWRVGLVDSALQQPVNGIFIGYRSNTACSTTGTDTEWMAETRASGTSTRTTTLVSASNATRYGMHIYTTVAGTWKFQISTNGGAYSSPISIATNVPSASLSPAFELFGCDANNVSMHVDRFAMKITGLTR